MSEQETLLCAWCVLPAVGWDEESNPTCGSDGHSLGVVRYDGALVAALAAQARREGAEEALREAADLFACEPHSTEGDESEWAEFCWRCDARVTIRAAAADAIARAGETPTTTTPITTAREGE